MYCSKCGTELPENSKFCPQCGVPVSQYQQTSSTKFTTIQLRCKNCNSIMNVDEDDPILYCPACGSKELIQEDKDVTIERMRNRTKREGQQVYKEVELERQNVKKQELMYKMHQEEQQKEEQERKTYIEGPISKAVLVCSILCLLICIVNAYNKSFYISILAGIQFIVFLLSWFIGMRIIKVKGFVQVILLIVGVALFILYFTSNSGVSFSKKYDEINWENIVISSVVPEPPATTGEIESNSADDLIVYIYSINSDQYNEYIATCQEYGFNIDEDLSTNDYSAYNKEGYKLSLYFYPNKERLSIRVDVPKERDSVIWSDLKLGNIIPTTNSDYGSVITNSESKLKVEVLSISEEDYAQYIQDCKDNGFDVEVEEADSKMTSFNAEGYELTLSYQSSLETLTITLDAPLEMGKFNWPSSELVKGLPKTSTDYGHVSSDTSNVFTVYIGKTTYEDYNSYVDHCIKKGFDVDYSRYDYSFHAKDKDGDNLTVSYTKGNNEMRISVTNFKR